MSVAVEAMQTPVGAMANLQTTITDLETSKEAEKEEESGEQSNDIEATVSPRGKSLSYSKDEFFSIKDARLSNIRPAALSDKYCNRQGIWDPELWHYSAESEKRSVSPIDSKKSYLLDGIILSPQGRSFARGCQVNAEKQNGEVRNKISGRLGRGWDGRESKGRGRGRSSPSGEGRFDRNFKNERSDGSGKSRRRAGSLESQPEWFTHGPLSQRDTIELRGFDDVEKGNKRKKRKKDGEEGTKNERKQSPEEKISDDNRKFDINEFFDMAENALPISGMYDNQGTSSRFSQWFGNDRRSRSNSLNASLGNSQSNSRRSSIADELAEIAGLTLSSPARTPTPDPEFMFAPIVPAASEPCEPESVLNIIQDSDVDVQPLLDSVIPHKTVKGAVTLEDLEGKEGISTSDDGDEQGSKENEKSQVFLQLVETMKASGHLPEKPTPTIPDIPPHLLPRPPSSKDKSRAPTGSRSRSPSPLQLLQEVIRRTQSPAGFINPAPTAVERLMPSYDPLRTASPVADILSSVARARPLTPEELYGAPPVFNMDNTAAASDLFEFTGAVANIEKRMRAEKKAFQPRFPKMPDSNTVGDPTSSSETKAHTNYPAISQAFVPTSVLRKLHSDKQEQKPSGEKDAETSSLVKRNIPAEPAQRPSRDVPLATSPTKSPDSSQAFSSSASRTLMSPREFTSPKTTGDAQPEFLTPHRLPLPESPSMTPHSLPLPQTPLLQNTPKTSTSNPKQPLLTPHSLPLPQSPLVTSASSNPPSDFGIRPLPKTAGVDDSQRLRARGNQGMFRKPFDPRQNNMRRLPQGPMPYRGQVPITPKMIPRPGMVPSPFNMNAARAMNVHPTALALALRNQQYQMARAAAVAAATAAVNRPPVLSPAQAAAAAMMLNQQRASAGFHGIMPPVNPRMFPHTTHRPNLPPALQRQHHVVHHSGSDSNKDDSLSKWFSDAVLSQSQSQSVAPGRGAKVLSVEELERHTCV